LFDFRLLTTDDVVAAVRIMPDRQCSSDQMPTRLVKDNVEILAPFLVELFNRSLVQGIVTAAFRTAYIPPLLKRPDLDPADPKSYRPISNLLVLSKLLERLVVQQFPAYLTASKMLPELRSAYRAFHSDGDGDLGGAGGYPSRCGWRRPCDADAAGSVGGV
jgi:hypothetical protein